MRTYQVDRQKKEEKRVFEEVFPGGQEVDVWKTERTAQGITTEMCKEERVLFY